MNSDTNNIELGSKEYKLLIAYRKADFNFRMAVDRLLGLSDKVIPFTPIKGGK